MENNRLKFRAWDGIRMYEWLESEIIEEEGIFYFKSYESGNNSLTCYTKPWNDNSLTKIQFTGLRTNDGIEVYEGDVFRYWYELDANGEGGTITHYGKAVCKFENGAFYIGDSLASDWLSDDDNYEKIGTIYENPELFE